ncbi:MAG: response regulator transcription factor [Bacteroidota bacterium]
MAKGSRILVVDDDRDILDLLEYNLEKEGFKVKCLDSSTGVLEVVATFQPDLVILDVMMPGWNGIEVCKRLRALPWFHDTYIFFLTARSEFYFQEAAYETGADDYIEKIVGMRALTHKVVTVLNKNYVIRKREQELTIGPLKINRRKGTVAVHQREIPLSKPEMELLFFFAQNPNKVISAELLQNNIWGSEVFATSLSLSGYVENLAKKMGDAWITVAGENKYRFRLPGV